MRLDTEFNEYLVDLHCSPETGTRLQIWQRPLSHLMLLFCPHFTPPSSADPFHHRMPIPIDEIEMELGGEALLELRLSIP